MNKRIKATVRNLFLTKGMKYTARQINAFCNFNDARKVISDLRKEGMSIRDYRNDDGTKTYYLVPDNQLNLWEGLDNG
jgi:predicted xylose isomerase-like sugar epimerase